MMFVALWTTGVLEARGVAAAFRINRLGADFLPADSPYRIQNLWIERNPSKSATLPFRKE
jgi:hypothetical protein